MKLVSQRITALVLLVMMMFGTAGMSALAAQATPEATPAPAPVIREVLVSGSPVGAPGQVLQLVRYIIPANNVLPIHIHPGMQTAYVESGTLHYTVLEGSMAFTRADGTIGELSNGEETDFVPGDTLVESQGMVHFGENRTDRPVILLVASLFEADEPPSTIVEAPPVATPAP